MTVNSTAFAVCALLAAIAAILLGHTAGQFFNAGANPAGTKCFAVAILTSVVAGGFAYGAVRTFVKKVKPPAPPVDPTRHHCRID